MRFLLLLSLFASGVASADAIRCNHEGSGKPLFTNGVSCPPGYRQVGQPIQAIPDTVENLRAGAEAKQKREMQEAQKKSDEAWRNWADSINRSARQAAPCNNCIISR